MESETRPSPVHTSDSCYSENTVKKMLSTQKCQIKRSSVKDRFCTRKLGNLDPINYVQSQPKDNNFTEHLKTGIIDDYTISDGTKGYSNNKNHPNIPVPSTRIVKSSEVKAIKGKTKVCNSGIPKILTQSSLQLAPTDSKSSQLTHTKKQPAPLKTQGTFVKEKSRIPTLEISGKKHNNIPNLFKRSINKHSLSMRTSDVQNLASNNSLKNSGNQWAGSDKNLSMMDEMANINSNTSLNSNISATSSVCSVSTTLTSKQHYKGHHQ